MEYPEAFVSRTTVQEEVAQKLMRALPNEGLHLQIAGSWHCFRTYTEDQLPIWGEDELMPRLFWLAAFGGFGMSTSFAAAEDAASAICREKMLNISDFSPGRARMSLNFPVRDAV